MEFRDTLVLVTGASRGIGLAIAEAVHAEGGRLVLVARETDALHAAAERLGAQALAADLTDPAALDGLIERAGDDRHPRQQRRHGHHQAALGAHAPRSCVRSCS